MNKAGAEFMYRQNLGAMVRANGKIKDIPIGEQKFEELKKLCKEADESKKSNPGKPYPNGEEIVRLANWFNGRGVTDEELERALY